MLSRGVCLTAVSVILIAVLGIGIFDHISIILSEQEDEGLNMTELELIGKNKIKSALTGEEVTIDSLWENQPVVLTFFRRWGCILCRVHARQFSAIKEQLDANNVRLVGIGVEDLGKDDFIKGEFFNGELFVDEEKKTYKDMKYKRFSKLSLIPALFSKSSRDGISESRATNVQGDLKGDYYQVGGTLVISAGGEKILLNHKQESLGDHIPPSKVLDSLGIVSKELNLEENGAECKLDGTTECTA